MSKTRFLQLTTLFYAGMALVTLLLSRVLTGDYWPSPLSLSWAAAGTTLVASGLLMALVWVLTRFKPAFLRNILEKLEPFKSLLIGLNQAERVYVSLLAGFSEELLFRGFLQPLWGLAAASIIFGALHAFTPGYFLLTAAAGFYLGGLFAYTGNLLVPMAVHALYDIFALNLMAWIYCRRE